MKIYNHIAFKMGQKEKELASYIKEGGNWQDIPLNVRDTRLDGIRKTGGRTTYYGRLRWDKPSYTISTYYNRVGNGCNLHPSQRRVISTREAARLQSFPDDFRFVGTKTSIYKQIGNAVPPLLARYISTLIKPHLNSYNFVDLFAGCGGLSEGFIQNGFNLLAVNELDQNIIQTNIWNHSKYTDRGNFILGDITSEEIKHKIFDACKNKSVDVILGGPPCQGFSYAGWRNPDDKRNLLFREFVSVVQNLKPKFFVMENVLGILTMRNGETIKEIIKAFAECGYFVHTPLKLNASEYGVPQRRKRVILIGCRDELKIQTPSPLFSEDDIFLPKPITVYDAISSLPPIDDGGGIDEIDYEFQYPTTYDLLMQKQIDFEKFYSMMLESRH